MAAQSFMEGEDAVAIDRAHAQVKLSMIFKWYKEDFGTQSKKVNIRVAGEGGRCWIDFLVD